MKKLVALLLAGVLSAGVLALTACDNGGNDDSADSGECHYPQIPEGVTLNDVKVTDAIDKDLQLSEKRYASDNVIHDQYSLLKETHYDDGEVTSLEETEVYVNVKYLNEDGKTYGENHRKSSLIRKNSYYRDDLGIDIDYEEKSEYDAMTFVRDNTVGTKRQSYYYTKTNDEVEEVNVPMHLSSYAVNAMEVLKNDGVYSGIRILAYHPYGSENLWLPYSGYDVKANTEYKLTDKQDPTKLFINANADDIMWWIDSSDIVIKNYNSTFKSDGTKMFFEYSYKAEFVNYQTNKVDFSWEYKYATYLDTDANLTAGDFKETYVTDDLLTDTYYYDCDKQSVGQAFLAGNDAVIDILGGGEKPADGEYVDNRTQLAQIKYCDTVSGAYTFAGINNYSIVNGKLVIKADWESFDQEAEMLNGMFSNEVDLSTAKRYLIISETHPEENKSYIARTLTIPLN